MFRDERGRDLYDLPDGPVHGTVLLEGGVVGLWRLDRDRGSGDATLVINHVGRLTKQARAALAAEGRRFIRFFAESAASHEVRFARIET